ncbi:MAG: carboxypeptidase regulatory-like domain-containing protein [Deltaproteobacteria bacterium]|nr:MAG: carboxypeptidase regulatory-like domain-containing protein [Deltaproteobacteria bacterium]
MSSSSSSRLLGSLLLALPLALACGKPPELTGKVQDIWGKPIPNATVTVEGQVEQATTDGQGVFHVPAPEAPTRIMAGKEGYIRNVAAYAPPAEEGEEPAPVTISLYPDPGEVGFYAVGRSDYKKLVAVEAVTKGTEVRAITGLPDIGDALIPQDEPLRFVFSSTLRPERLAQLKLQLHKLEFVQQTELPGVLGETPTAVNLWTATGNPIPYDLTSLPSKDDYLITLREKLPAGAYAFHTQDALTNQSYGALDKLPKELRTAYVFEVK